MQRCDLIGGKQSEISGSSILIPFRVGVGELSSNKILVQQRTVYRLGMSRRVSVSRFSGILRSLRMSTTAASSRSLEGKVAVVAASTEGLVDTSVHAT